MDTLKDPLTPRQRQILARRREGRTLREIGDEFGITPERVRQLLAKSDHKLASAPEAVQPYSLDPRR